MLILITIVAVTGLVAALRWSTPGRTTLDGSEGNGKGDSQQPLVFCCGAGLMTPVEAIRRSSTPLPTCTVQTCVWCWPTRTWRPWARPSRNFANRLATGRRSLKGRNQNKEVFLF